jgi:hypothetical protein
LSSGFESASDLLKLFREDRQSYVADLPELLLEVLDLILSDDYLPLELTIFF